MRATKSVLFVDGTPRSLPPMRSIRITSAPMSASSMAQNGPGPMPAISMIVTPFSGPKSKAPSRSDILQLVRQDFGECPREEFIANLMTGEGLRIAASDVELASATSRRAASGTTRAGEHRPLCAIERRVDFIRSSALCRAMVSSGIRSGSIA